MSGKKEEVQNRLVGNTEDLGIRRKESRFEVTLTKVKVSKNWKILG